MTLVRFLPLILALCTVSSALVIPKGLPNGVYLFPIDDKGNALGEPILLRPPTGRSLPTHGSGSSLNRRQRGGGGSRQTPPPLPNPKTTCTGRQLDQKAFNVARDLFDTMCDKAEYYPANNARVIANDGVISYMCNFNATNRCWREEYNEAVGLMDNACSSGISATVYTPHWQKSYGRDLQSPDDTICHGP